VLPALQRRGIGKALAEAGFENISIEPVRIYGSEEARSFLQEKGVDEATIASHLDGKFMSGFIRANKPRQ
jgi:hypothetical protein